MTGVVSETEKAGQTRQVSAGKTSVSKPSSTCRKRRDAIETRLQSLAWDAVRAMPAYGPDGDRHEGGVSLAQALAWNVGTCRRGAKGECQGAEPQGREYRNAAQGRISP